MDFTRESQDRFVDWFVRHGQDESWVDAVAHVMKIVERDRWDMLRWDEVHVRHAVRRVVQTVVPHLFVVIDLIVDDDGAGLVADLVNAWFEDE